MWDSPQLYVKALWKPLRYYVLKIISARGRSTDIFYMAALLT